MAAAALLCGVAGAAENGQLQLPSAGLGLGWRASADEIAQSILSFLQAGGRLIDTALHYQNHEVVRRALSDAQARVNRRDIFVVSKLGSANSGYARGKVGIAQAVKELGGAVDLMLIHHPEVGNTATNQGSWRALNEAKKLGSCRYIGVSNMGLADVVKLSPPPDAVEVELHPWVPYDVRALVSWCQNHGVPVLAYGLLGGAAFNRTNYPEDLRTAASALGMSPETALLRWVTEMRGVTALFGSRTPEHIVENMRILGPSYPPLGPALRDAIERAGRPVGYMPWGGTTRVVKSGARGRVDCVSEWLAFVESELGRIRRIPRAPGQPAFATFNVSNFDGLRGPPCVLPADYPRVAVAQKLSQHLQVSAMPFVILPPHLVFDGGEDRRTWSVLEPTRRRVRDLDSHLCSTPSDGQDRRIPGFEAFSALSRWFKRSPLLSEMGFQYLRRATGISRAGSASHRSALRLIETHGSRNFSSAGLGHRQPEASEVLCAMAPSNCRRSYTFGPTSTTVVAGLTPRGASPGAGWHVDVTGIPHLKSLMYLTDVLAPEQPAFTMAVGYETRTLPSLSCKASGMRRCTWPACVGDRAFNRSMRFNDQQIHEQVLSRGSAVAVQLYAPAGTIIFFDGQSLHRGRQSESSETRLSITNYHDLSFELSDSSFRNASAHMETLREEETATTEKLGACLDATPVPASDPEVEALSNFRRSSLLEGARWQAACRDRFKSCKRASGMPELASASRNFCEGARDRWLAELGSQRA